MELHPVGRPRAAVRLGAVVVVAVALAACSSSKSSTSTTGTTGGGLSGSITVSAAASLKETFGTMKTNFEKAHPGTTINFNFGSSAALVTQITQGAPADVFASASKTTMDDLVSAGKVEGHPEVFAKNTLEIVVKPGNPLGITSLADLTKAKTVALCASDAPCGAAADKALKQDGITLPTSQVTRGADVKATLAEVTTGDADAAVVYVTDAKTVTSSEGTAVPIAASQNIITSYEIAQVKGSKNGDLDQEWIAYVTGPEGQAVLAAAGFMPPG
ncbi:MAG TPA: molybdate ABC transporter substrate-binding protein [Acidimicrobiales bacterium]|nr:molybdate ABC transporter substrate-binding protein [Acidimicrobiales bacterium]